MILAFFITSLFIIGLHAITRDGMALGFVERWASIKSFYNRANEFMKSIREKGEDATGSEYDEYKRMAAWLERHESIGCAPDKVRDRWFMKPLTECATCMSSVWGTTGFLFTSLEWYWLPVWIVCMAGFINLLTSIAWRE